MTYRGLIVIAIVLAPLLSDASAERRNPDIALPMSFEANRGQAEPQVKYVSRGRGSSLFLTTTEATLALFRKRPGSVEPNSFFLGMKFPGGNPRPVVEGLDELPGKANYFTGNDPEQWRTDVPLYRKVRYAGVYPGIDVVFYGNGEQLEYDFVVAAGASPKAIRVSFEGAQHIGIDPSGDLLLKVDGEEIRLHKPVAYQNHSGVRRAISARYVLSDRKRISIRLGSYDDRETLIIDPILSYAIYLGGSSSASAVAVDSAGNTYVTGTTVSPDFPVVNALQDFGNPAGCISYNGPFGGNYPIPCPHAFIAKLNSDGSAFVYITFLGGTFADSGTGVAVDIAGNAYVTGVTDSSDFPLVNPLMTRGSSFVLKLNPAGSALIYSTRFGGTRFGASGTDAAYAIAVDAGSNAYVTGGASSTDFPAVNPVPGGTCSTDGVAFVMKLNATGSSLIYSTCLGSGGPSVGIAIAVDTSGNAYITGETVSRDLVTLNAAQASPGGDSDAFVSKLDASGSLIYSTYLGGARQDLGWAIAADSIGNAYVTGSTASDNFPTRNPLQRTRATPGADDAFITKFDQAGVIVYSTYLGGSSSDAGFGIVVDNLGNASVAGDTLSPDFPMVNPIQPIPGGRSDAFVATLNASGSALLFSTYLGGTGDDQARGIAIDAQGNLPIAGNTTSEDFPTAGSLQSVYTRGTDGRILGNAFVANIAEPTDTSCSVSLEKSSASVTASGGTGGFNVVSNTGCGWTATSNADWIFVTEGAGSGPNAVFFSFTDNTQSTPRTGTISVSGQTFTVTQQGAGASTVAFEPQLVVPHLTQGYYTVEATLAEGASGGFWGLEVLTSSGQISGGFNLGGGLAANAATPGFGAFFLPTPERVTATATAPLAPMANITLSLLDSNRQPIAINRGSAAGSPSLQAALQPGFYIVEITTDSPAPVNYSLAIAADFFNADVAVVFSGGVDVGGYIGPGITGFGAFYVPFFQDVSMHLFGRNTYGAAGAGSLVLTLRDANRTVIQQVGP